MSPQILDPPAQHDGMLDKLGHIVRISPASNEYESVSTIIDTSANLLSGVVHDLASQKMFIPEDINLIVSSIQTEIDGGLIDDKSYLVRSSLSITVGAVFIN